MATIKNFDTKKRRALGFLPFGYGLFFVSSAILGIALVLFVVLGGPFGESRFVQDDKYQAVFVDLNSSQGQPNQVYFGRVTALNDNYFRLRDVFYIQSTSSSTNGGEATTQNTLKKLGCELHGPQDEMVINRDHVIFWENLKDDGQVVQKINEFHKLNPDGQKCEQPANQTPGQTTTTPNQ